MCSDFSLNKSAVRTKNCSLNMSADQHNFMGTDGLELKMPNDGWRTKSFVHKFRLHSRRGKGMAESFSRKKIKARTAERRLMRNPVRPFFCVTPAGTSNELDVQNEWEENTQTHNTLYVLVSLHGKCTECDGGLLPDIILSVDPM